MKLSPATLWRRNEKRRKYLGVMGEVVAFSQVFGGPPQLSKRTPYVVAMVEVENERFMTQLSGVSFEKVEKGMKVKGVLRRMFDVDDDALIVYGVKFVSWKEL